MKKLITLGVAILCVAMVAVLFYGCGNNTEDMTTTTTTEATTTTPEETTTVAEETEEVSEEAETTTTAAATTTTTTTTTTADTTMDIVSVPDVSDGVVSDVSGENENGLVGDVVTDASEAVSEGLTDIRNAIE